MQVFVTVDHTLILSALSPAISHTDTIYTEKVFDSFIQVIHCTGTSIVMSEYLSHKLNGNCFIILGSFILLIFCGALKIDKKS